MNDPIIKILLIALGVKILFFLNDSDIYETIGIIVAIILATVISSLSEYGSEKAFQKLTSFEFWQKFAPKSVFFKLPTFFVTRIKTPRRIFTIKCIWIC